MSLEAIVVKAVIKTSLLSCVQGRKEDQNSLVLPSSDFGSDISASLLAFVP
jgi:hypothetical protein